MSSALPGIGANDEAVNGDLPRLTVDADLRRRPARHPGNVARAHRGVGIVRFLEAAAADELPTDAAVVAANHRLEWVHFVAAPHLPTVEDDVTGIAAEPLRSKQLDLAARVASGLLHRETGDERSAADMGAVVRRTVIGIDRGIGRTLQRQTEDIGGDPAKRGGRALPDLHQCGVDHDLATLRHADERLGMIAGAAGVLHSDRDANAAAGRPRLAIADRAPPPPPARPSDRCPCRGHPARTVLHSEADCVRERRSDRRPVVARSYRSAAPTRTTPACRQSRGTIRTERSWCERRAPCCRWRASDRRRRSGMRS